VVCGTIGSDLCVVLFPFSFARADNELARRNPMDWGVREQPGGLATTGDAKFTSDIFDIYNRSAHIDDGEQDEHKGAPGDVLLAANNFLTLCKFPSQAWQTSTMTCQPGLGFGSVPSLYGTCGTCYDTPNVGNHSFPTSLNIGTGNPTPINPSVNLAASM
jgi:hypothetical protein